ncbi:YcaO-like family protein [Actinacidiphila acididurans]|uniref:YcaO-like family protein n=1 Tax=Actinacidiphila acididurans TaxID=2784346 RepID=A0ABS2U4B6_9ACTN|nr:YcaO-like family protein [Actinacidiphila acididurans]MBM9510469.1 YcaO-like family protein [Actinacidiphila acididurans]
MTDFVTGPVTGVLKARVIVAAEPSHVAVIDGAARVDIQLDGSHPPVALSQSLHHSVGRFADLVGEDAAAIAEALDAAGLLGTADEARPPVADTAALADVLRHPARLAAGTLVHTADEAFWPGTDPEPARAAFRVFVSRLSGLNRCQVYALLAAGHDLSVAGDRPDAQALAEALAAARKAASLGDHPCVIDLRTGSTTGVVREPGDIWNARAGRLSVTASTPTDRWQITAERTITVVSGWSAFPNLANFPALADREALRGNGYPRAAGAATDPLLAEAKCQAEGAERFAAGDVPADDLHRAAARDLSGAWLDPRSIIDYAPAQRDRLGLGTFDPDGQEWWVRGEDRDGPVWIPAALVFFPFTRIPAWLSPSAVSSNGVAAHPTYDGARRRAWLELVERDAFQRARFVGPARPPSRIRPSSLRGEARELMDYLAGQASAHALVLPSPTGVPVVLVRADTERAVALGAAAADDVEDAVAKAATEAVLQTRHPIEMDIEVTQVFRPADHAGLYNLPQWRPKLDWMLEGPELDVGEFPFPVARPGPIGERACWYTYPSGGPDLHVVRVLDPELIPLTFGYDSDPTARDDVRTLLRDAGFGDEEPLDPHAFA